MSLVTVIGRGHSGTRAISHTLYASGVFMGRTLNPSGDLVPPGSMYDACRVAARCVKWPGGLEWDFSGLIDADIPPEFDALLDDFLTSVRHSKAEKRGWKIPETTLVYPWIVRRFPDAKYIFWVRNPRDCILASHKTDDLRDFGIDYPLTDDLRLRRAISWKYQYALVRACPKPRHWLEVRFEDFVLDQEATLQRLEAWLGYPLARIIVRPEAVNRWQRDDGVNYYDFLAPAMQDFGYEIPERA